MKMNKKGFTLIEVLIVVVIIAVLAALILPRFMNQAERAVIAEAQQILGAMRRGELNWQDMTETAPGTQTSITSCGFTTDCATTAAEWAVLGVTPPLVGTGAFDYDCDAVDTCTATRNAANATYSGSTIALNTDTGAFTCGGSYTAVGNNRGCTPQ